MGIKIKVNKKISPKDKSKIKRKVTKAISVKTDGNKILSIDRSRNVKNNKKNK